MVMTPTFLYLASQSPRRSQLLAQLGVAHELLLADAAIDIAEDSEALEAAKPAEAPRDYVQRVTQLKLDAAVARHTRRDLAPAPILCSDTTVALGEQILGKPESTEDAARILGLLSGQQHQVLTAVAVQCGARRLLTLSSSTVEFMALTPAQIERYISSGEPMGKAGAYGIQGLAAGFIAHMSGSYSGIMGLPLFETSGLLRELGWPI